MVTFPTFEFHAIYIKVGMSHGLCNKGENRAQTLEQGHLKVIPRSNVLKFLKNCQIQCFISVK